MADEFELAEDNGTIRICELMGQALFILHRKDDRVATYLTPDEAEALGQALIRSAMICREQTQTRCKNTHNPGFWPFVARCTLYMDQHEGRMCIDRYNKTFTPTD